MNVSSLNQFQLSDLLLLCLLGGATVTDCRTRRIPNVLVLAGLVTGIALALLERGLHGVGFAIAGVVLGFVLLAPLFALGWLGAGDVKLLSATGAYAGASGVAMVAGLSAMAGGVLGAIMWWRSGQAGLKARLPYAVALLCGTLGWMVLR